MTSLLKMRLLENLSYAVTIFFFLIVLSYYFLLFIKHKKAKKVRSFSSITIIMPAHNEEKYIKEAIDSVIAADFNGSKEIIIVDDGSIDSTAEIASKYVNKNIKLLRTKHSGKSASINRALESANGELISIVDADSCIHKNALVEMSDELTRDKIAGVCGIVKVKNRMKPICMWVHIELLFGSLMRSLFSKVNANITTPGALSMYIKKNLVEVGGFSTKGYSEDVDITIRLIRKGYKIGFRETAITETNMPYDIKGFIRQRKRFARGAINIVKKHLRLNNTIIDIYTLPILLFSLIQSLIMGSFITYQIINGYITYFYSKGIYFNFVVLKFFFEWFSLAGFVRWLISVFSGQTPLTLITVIGIISTFLSYPLIILAILKYDRKIDLWHFIPLFFMFPFWFLLMLINIYCVPEYFKKEQYNIWKKNE